MQLRDAPVEQSNRLHITIAWDRLVKRMVDRAGSTTEKMAQAVPVGPAEQQDDEVNWRWASVSRIEELNGIPLH